MQIIIEYDRENIDDCRITTPQSVSPAELIVVLCHAISCLAGNEMLEEKLLASVKEEGDLYGQI